MKNVGTYIQFVDMSFPTVARNYNSKMDKGFFEEFFSNIKVKDTIKYKGEEQMKRNFRVFKRKDFDVLNPNVVDNDLLYIGKCIRKGR